MKNLKIIEIPLPSDKFARWEMGVDLSGKRYWFYVSYNTRMDSYFMSIMDVNKNLLLGGIRLVPGVHFLEKYRPSVPELPQGDLELVNKQGETAPDVTRDNLHRRFMLIYTTIEEG
jgi:hypothetical protein